jgi:hypothetical protein
MWHLSKLVEGFHQGSSLLAVPVVAPLFELGKYGPSSAIRF